MINRDDLAKYLSRTLDITRFNDYCPNGLQVQGRETIQKLVTGVTASISLLEAAIDKDADAILVHHGYFWRGDDARVIGQKHRRLKLLLSHDISLFAYHLPLDSHAGFGNNAQLGHLLDLQVESRFAENDLGWLGIVKDPAIQSIGDFAAHIEQKTGRAPLVIGESNQPLGKIGWCTGAAQGFFGDAIAAGATLYLSGEISESTVHLARESGVTYMACGHHATERYGVQALGDHLATVFGIEHQFVDIDNPV